VHDNLHIQVLNAEGRFPGINGSLDHLINAVITTGHFQLITNPFLTEVSGEVDLSISPLLLAVVTSQRNQVAIINLTTLIKVQSRRIR